MVSKDPDELRTVLLLDYAAATEHYAWAVGELNRQRAVLPLDHYKGLYRVAEDARGECERLRMAIAKLETTPGDSLDSVVAKLSIR